MQEARGLDSWSRLVNKFVSQGDKISAKIIDQICREEIQHVRVGMTWYEYKNTYIIILMIVIGSSTCARKIKLTIQLSNSNFMFDSTTDSWYAIWSIISILYKRLILIRSHLQSTTRLDLKRVCHAIGTSR